MLLIGASGNPNRIEKPIDCGACGYPSYMQLLDTGKRLSQDFLDHVFIFQAIDLGIALGSAVNLASELKS